MLYYMVFRVQHNDVLTICENKYWKQLYNTIYDFHRYFAELQAHLMVHFNYIVCMVLSQVCQS